jgi:hypothetical protein
MVGYIISIAVGPGYGKASQRLSLPYVSAISRMSNDVNEFNDEMGYSKLVSQLESIAAHPQEALLNNEPVRKRLLQAATHVIPEIEKPTDSAHRILYTSLELMAALIGHNSQVLRH